jgi:hypothetical protein
MREAPMNHEAVLSLIGELTVERDKARKDLQELTKLASDQFTLIANCINGEPEVRSGISVAQMAVEIIARLRKQYDNRRQVVA